MHHHLHSAEIRRRGKQTRAMHARRKRNIAGKRVREAITQQRIARSVPRVYQSVAQVPRAYVPVRRQSRFTFARAASIAAALFAPLGLFGYAKA